MELAPTLESRLVNRFPLGFILTLFCLFLQLQGLDAQGISTAAPIGPYLNGAFPDLTPSQGTGPASYTTTNAFPNLTFVDPVKMLEMPGNRFMVVGKSGQVWMFNNQPSTSAKILLMDIKDQVVIAGDGGMMGGILHPEFGQA